MIGAIIGWSLGNRFLVLLAAGVLLVWGTWVAVRMPVDIFPDLTAPAVTVVVEAHGMAPVEVEQRVTIPIETALNGAAAVRRVRSSSAVGIAVVLVEFEWGMDIHRARQIVGEKLQLARADLPPDISAPVLAPVSSVMGEIMFIALTSDRHDPMALKREADWVIRRRLLAIPGVAQVLNTGGDTRQFQVVLRPEELARRGITVDEVLAALRDSNENASAGFYLEGGQEYLIRGLGLAQDREQIADTLVAVHGAQPVLVRHLADVVIGPAPKRGTAAANGEPAVVIGIQKQPLANTLMLTHQVDRVLADIERNLPEGMRLDTHVFRQADFIGLAVENLAVALRDGALLVVLIVLAFLVSLRATLITLLALPLSLVVAVLAMHALGVTVNTMTLGGMAIALGALVDDAIIVVENVVRRLRGAQGQANANADADALAQSRVFAATREIQGSIVFATLVIMLVFLPLFVLPGVEGRLLAPLGFAYVVSLAASLLTAITVTPVLASLLLPRTGIVRQTHGGHLEAWLLGAYVPLLRLLVGRWLGITVLALTGVVLALIALAQAGRSFLPDFNEGSLTLGVVTLPGTALEESDRIGRMVEHILLRHPEVASTARRTGRAAQDPHAQEVHASEIDVRLQMRERSKEDLLASLRADLAAVPGTHVVIGQPISHRIDHMLSGTRANVAVKLFGPDLAELRRLGGRIESIVRAVPGAVDVALEQQAEIPVLTIEFDRLVAARHGFSMAGMSRAVETAFVGQAVSVIREGEASFDLVVRFPEALRRDIESLRATLLVTPTGARVPLHALADVRRDIGPNVIGRENVQRRIVVMANVAGRDLIGTVNDIRSRIHAAVALPTGYHIEFGGQFERASEATRLLALLGVLVVIGIFALLFVAFGSARDALLVMLNLPLALIGGVAGVFLAGGVVSVASIVGFITLFGIATRNGVMLVAHIRRLSLEEGVTHLREAVERGARERLLPILMTALATGLALVPLARSAGQPGSEIQAPMAIVILCGLVTSTLLNMFVVPALYLRFGALAARARVG